MIFVGIFLHDGSDNASEPGVILLIQVRQRDSGRWVRCPEAFPWQQDDAAFVGEPKQDLELVFVAQQPIDKVTSIALGSEDLEIETV